MNTIKDHAIIQNHIFTQCILKDISSVQQVCKLFRRLVEESTAYPIFKAVQTIMLPFSEKYHFLTRVWAENEAIIYKLPKFNWIDKQLPYCTPHQQGSISGKWRFICNDLKEKTDAIITTKFNHELNDEFSERLASIDISATFQPCLDGWYKEAIETNSFVKFLLSCCASISNALNVAFPPKLIDYGFRLCLPVFYILLMVVIDNAFPKNQ